MGLLGLACALLGGNPFFIFKVHEGGQTTTMLVMLREKLIIVPVHMVYFTSEFVTFNYQPRDFVTLIPA